MGGNAGPEARPPPGPSLPCPHPHPPPPGLYACKGGHNSPCLVYVTFNQKIYVYWEVQLERMESTNLLKLLEAEPEYRDLLQELGVDPDDLPAARALLHHSLYHPDQAPRCAPTGLQGPT